MKLSIKKNNKINESKHTRICEAIRSIKYIFSCF